MNLNLFCISEDELAADRAALTPAELAAVDTLPSSFPVLAPVAPAKKRDARRDEYTGPFPRKRHYHRCPHCRDHGSNGVNCYKQRCTTPVLMDYPCSWCRPVGDR
jgi:hypothetical protein